MDFIEHSVIEFKAKNHLTHNVTLKKLVLVCRKKGYIIKTFSSAKTFLIALGIFQDLKSTASYTVIDNNGNTIILLRDGMSARLRLFALAHELGHIYLKHEDRTDEAAEEEANRFAHLLISKKPVNWLNFILASICVIFSAYFLFLTAQPPITNPDTNTSQILSPDAEDRNTTDICYYAEYSEVYHLYKDCYYLKNSKKIYTDTVGNCNRDRLCSACEYKKFKEE